MKSKQNPQKKRTLSKKGKTRLKTNKEKEMYVASEIHAFPEMVVKCCFSTLFFTYVNFRITTEDFLLS